MKVGEGRPPEADARKLIRSFLDCGGWTGVPFHLHEDGETTWAWWIREDGDEEDGDTTSYCYYNESNATLNNDAGLCVEWLGTSAPQTYASVTIRTQADADRLVPELLRAPGERVLLVRPTEALDLPSATAPHCDNCDGEQRITDPEHPDHPKQTGDPSDHDWCPVCTDFGDAWKIVGIDRVIVDGGDDPMHPNHVRQLRDDCEAAGVAFVFASWGEWVSMFDYNAQWPDGQGEDMGLPEMRGMGDGSVMFRVGRKLSGRMLDGREFGEPSPGGQRWLGRGY